MSMDQNYLKLEEELRRARDESAEARRQVDDLQQLLTDFLNHNPALSFIKDERGRSCAHSRAQQKKLVQEIEPAELNYLSRKAALSSP